MKTIRIVIQGGELTRERNVDLYLAEKLEDAGVQLPLMLWLAFPRIFNDTEALWKKALTEAGVEVWTSCFDPEVMARVLTFQIAENRLINP